MTNLSTAQLRAMLKEAEAADKKARENARSEAFEGILQPVFDAVVLTEKYADSDSPTSTWAGFDSRGHAYVDDDGREWTISVRLTHVSRVAEKEAALRAKVEALTAEPAQA